MTRAMTEDEREAFLAEPRVGVISVAGEHGRAPLAVPIWYAYSPGGDVGFIMPRDGRKAKLIRRAGRVSLCVQSTDTPYRYVSVEGPVTGVQEIVSAQERRELASRYLGPRGGDEYVETSADATHRMIMIRMSPQRWLTQDQGGMAAAPPPGPAGA